MIIADENIPILIIEKLRLASIETFSVFDNLRGISDKEIIEFAQNPPKIILTEDKDFGDLVFAYNQKKVSVILLRYHYLELEKIESILINFLQNHLIEEYSFIVITPKNIRIRKF
jgi:predicted nuclease of predicted toxin-antitoxin system